MPLIFLIGLVGLLKMKKLKYIFEEIQTCEMCGDSTKNHIVLGQRLNQSQGIKPKSKTGGFCFSNEMQKM